MVEQEKSVEELAAELEAVATVPEDFERESDKPKKRTETVKVAVQTKSAMEPPIASPISSQSSVPVEVAPALPIAEAPLVASGQGSFSLDGLFARKVEEVKHKIDVEADLKKRAVEERIYGKFSAFIDSLTDTEATSVPVAVEVKPKIVEVPSNIEAIRKIDALLADPKGRGKKTLQRLRAELEGKPVASEPVKNGGGWDLKTKLVAASVVVTAGVGAFLLALIFMGVIP